MLYMYGIIRVFTSVPSFVRLTVSTYTSTYRIGKLILKESTYVRIDEKCKEFRSCNVRRRGKEAEEKGGRWDSEKQIAAR